MPYKSAYSIGEFWAEFTQGSLYKAYAKANPVESANIAFLIGKKIRQEAWQLPNDLAKTHTGKAIVMAFLTMPSQPRDR